ncbi:MAG: universal stress protein [Burkholderiales bacterium]
MTYGSILVPIDEHPDAAGSLETARRLARAFGAHLEGLAVVTPLALPQRLRPRQSAAALMKKEWERDKAEARAAAARFEAAAQAAGVASAEGLVVEARAPEAFAVHARTTDLVVLPLPVEDDIGVLGGHRIESSMLAVGRPVLLVPAQGAPADFPGKALVAWNGSREAARALSDAVPLLALAKSVVVFSSGPAGEEGSVHGAKAAVGYLARRGIKADASHASVPDERVGRTILSRAAKAGAGLVVMGAYGRPRFAELVLGGTTRTVLREARIPVLMSH